MNSQHTNRILRMGLTCAAISLPMVAQATEGYFALGYSPAARGVAGAGVAATQDAMSVATNPASVAELGEELSLGLQIFSPERGYTGTGTGFIAPGTWESGSDYFPVPNFAYNKPLANGAVLNFAAYGNGGMNTTYENVANPNCLSGVFCAGDAGVDLTQMFLSVTFANKVGRLSYGLSPTVAVQAFEATGLSALSANSIDPAHFSDNGHDFSYGVGLKFGVQYDVTDQLTLGFAAQTKFDMSEFDKYAGLFEGGGDFDIPASVTLGLAYETSPAVTLMLDYQKIFYSGVPAVSNAMNGTPFGTNGGPGFGWDDVEVLRVGVEWVASDTMTWRAGYAYATNPISSADVALGVLAPGIVEHHFAVGGSKKLNDRDTIDFSVSYVPENTVTGPVDITMGGGDVELYMSQISASVGWTRTF
ncbi:OmpP1/FadL family transporter [Celeribacter litoreus]|uniref:OmpP1/FadL family transporter n=1 Tax=Celeribacter litoreus TaxID=2876714 RepID=UPI001CCFB29C|nr:outer membrane protein transport protein [Celeribacter litoreus]MCA0042820.1 outer membrane protein transport protein [Celeribacter litoreus]